MRLTNYSVNQLANSVVETETNERFICKAKLCSLHDGHQRIFVRVSRSLTRSLTFGSTSAIHFSRSQFGLIRSTVVSPAETKRWQLGLEERFGEFYLIYLAFFTTQAKEEERLYRDLLKPWKSKPYVKTQSPAHCGSGSRNPTYESRRRKLTTIILKFAFYVEIKLTLFHVSRRPPKKHAAPALK